MVLLVEFEVFRGHIDLHMEFARVNEKTGWGKNRCRFGESSFRVGGVNISLKITSFA